MDSFSRFGDGFMCVLGALVFSILFMFLLLEKRKPLFGRLFDWILIAALSAEGYLLGFQLFGVGRICHFCFIVLTIFILTGFFRILQKRFWVAFGYLAAVAVLTSTFLVPPKGFYPLPKGKYVLIYSPECPHCRKVIEFLETKGVKFSKVEYKEVLNLLYTLRVDDIPVLLIREGESFKILVGESPIEELFEGKERETKPLLLAPQGRHSACSIFEENCGGSVLKPNP